MTDNKKPPESITGNGGVLAQRVDQSDAREISSAGALAQASGKKVERPESPKRITESAGSPGQRKPKPSPAENEPKK